jgi:hypothetical protein
MTAIDVGSASIDRATQSSAGLTYVSLTNPANESGTITALTIFMHSAGYVKVGTFHDAANGVYLCRSVLDLGFVPVGLNSFGGLSLAIFAGDYLGFYAASATIDADTTGGSGYAYRSGDQCVSGQPFAVTTGATWTFSIYATGDSNTAPDPGGLIAAVLDSGKDDYLPATEGWLYTNWPVVSIGNLLLALMAKFVLEGSGGGSGAGATLEEIQTALDALALDVEGVMATDIEGLDTAIQNHFSDQAQAMGTALSITEGNINAQTVVSQGVVTTQLDDLERNLISNLGDAMDAINLHSDGVGDSVVQRIEDDLPGQTLIIKAAITAAADGIVASVGGLITAAQGIVTASIAGAIGTITAAISAAQAAIIAAMPSPTGALVPPVYPGSASRTLSNVVAVSGTTQINGPMHGIEWSITQLPPGQSQQLATGAKKYKGLGWIVFVSDDGKGEPVQKIEIESGMAVPMCMRSAASVVVYTKPGTTLSVRTFSIVP